MAAFLGGCPIIDVPGSLHPLTIEYDAGESIAAALNAVLSAHKRQRAVLPARGARDQFGDRRERRRRRAGMMRSWFHFTARLTRRRRIAALAPASTRRRIIVATNIAETSLTVNWRVGGDRFRTAEGR